MSDRQVIRGAYPDVTTEEIPGAQATVLGRVIDRIRFGWGIKIGVDG